jgi:RNA polymerase sigma-54 factor
MGLETKLSLKQTQKLVMTAMLQQAIKLLPMARLELVQVIRQELTENPMLEEEVLAEDGTTPAEEDDAPSPAEAADTLTDGQELYDINWQEYFPEDWEWKGLPSEEYEERFSYENTVRTPTTLSEHLLAQLLLATTDAVERRVGAFLIGNIDDDGYLRGELDEAMAATQTDRATVERVLALIQSFDPAGIGARDLRECLLIQVRLLGRAGRCT